MRFWLLSGWLWTVLAPLPLLANDLKVVTKHQTAANVPPFTDTRYVKGQRIREEWRNSEGRAKRPGGPTTYIYGPPMATLYQCDQRRVVTLNLKAREYNDYEIDEYGLPVGALKNAKPAERSGLTVTVTIETRDTGERKEIFGHTARHVITKTKTTAPPGACTRSSESETDGWYIDLDVPGRCFEKRTSHVPGTSFLGSACGDKVDNFEVHRTGEAGRGFAVKLTTTTSSESVLPDGTTKPYTSTFEVEVIELSEAPLDAQLFEVPAGFRRVAELHSEPPLPVSLRFRLFWQRLKEFLASPFS